MWFVSAQGSRRLLVDRIRFAGESAKRCPMAFKLGLLSSGGCDLERWPPSLFATIRASCCLNVGVGETSQLKNARFLRQTNDMPIQSNLRGRPTCDDAVRGREERGKADSRRDLPD